MKIGIIGAGRIGSTVGRLLHAAGHDIYFGTRHPDQQMPLVAELGVRAQAGRPGDAARFGDVVIVAVPLRAIPEVARAIATAVSSKVVLETTNAYVQRDGELATQAENYPGGSSAWVASHLPEARVVKAFNSVEASMLRREAHRRGELIGIPIAGDDASAVAITEQLVRDAGFTPVPLGRLAEGKRVEPGTAVYGSGMNGPELAHALGRA